MAPVERVSAEAQVSESECASGERRPLSDAERNREAATSRLGEGAGADTAGTARAAGTRGEPEVGEAAPRSGLAGPHDSGEAHSDGVLERGQH